MNPTGLRRRFAGCAYIGLSLGACTLAPTPGTGADTVLVGALPPPGFGTLRQEDVSISLTSGDLQLMVTPLHESVTRVTAPDTERRLAGMAEAHRASGGEGTALFLVSFFSEQPDVRFVPEEVQLISRGLRLRPGTITPVTPTWGQRRVRQRQTEMAIYSFVGEVDLESDVTLVYGLEQTRVWSTILARIQGERARARARAGIGRSDTDRRE
jgi:hypothetical protein